MARYKTDMKDIIKLVIQVELRAYTLAILMERLKEKKILKINYDKMGYPIVGLMEGKYD